MKTRDKIRSVAGGQGKRGAVFPSFRQRAFTYPVEQESGGSRAGGWRCAGPQSWVLQGALRNRSTESRGRSEKRTDTHICDGSQCRIC